MGIYTIEYLKGLRESEDHIEFKAAEHGNFAYDGGTKPNPKDRRKCILGYVTALCNAGGGALVLGMHDSYPHYVVGTQQCLNALGILENKIYKDTGILTNIYELFENPTSKTGRVVVIEVEGRPIGRLFSFEDVYLTRVGEDLLPMPVEQTFSVLQETEPDFSSEICPGLKLSDLDTEAIKIFKERYSDKQKNKHFKALSDKQALSDVKLINGNKVTYAALILLGKKECIQKYLPQASIILEYRKSESSIAFDNRQQYCGPFFKIIDELWHDINLRNSKIDIQNNSYIDNIPYFREDVIREAINNAIAHRDYRKTSEVVIKLYPELFVVINAGGFPLGVTIDNLLEVPSTPRNRLLADVMAVTGLVERSGQGVDKIFRETISEGKEKPDYSRSDFFRVELHLSAAIKDVSFALFLESEQRDLKDEEKLSVFEVIALDEIRKNNSRSVPKNIIHKLLNRNLIEKRGQTSGTYYILSRSYYEFSDNKGEYSQKANWNTSQAMPLIFAHLSQFPNAKMRDFAALLEPHLSRRQVRSLIDSLVERGTLKKNGIGSGTYYTISESFIKSSELIVEAIGIGLEELKKRGSQIQNGQNHVQTPSKNDTKDNN